MSSHYDLVIGGTGFASSFFLLRYLERKPDTRVLVIERGPNPGYDWMLENRKQTPVDSNTLFTTRGLGTKEWLFTTGMGGGSSCWWGQTPRFLPEDFSLKSKYGVGYDWPIGYDDLAPYYSQAEEVMGIAGPSLTPFPKTGPYPQPPHHLSSFDRRMIAAVGDHQWIPAPTARSSTGTDNRGKCCANGVCGLCPVDAKFRVMNELQSLYARDNVDLQTSSELRTVNFEGSTAKSVTWVVSDEVKTATCDLVFLGLNAIFNATVMIRSGDKHPLIGKRLHEQLGVKVVADLTETEDFDGGTHITGLGYMFYAGDHRRDHGACLIEHQNAPPILRTEKGKWRKRALLKIVSENIPEDRNTVDLVNDKARLTFVDHTDYAKKGIQATAAKLEAVLAGIGLEKLTIGAFEPTEGHIQGTAVMAKNAVEGVVDDGLVHHQYRNLLIGGASAFPSGPPSNPSLTVAALSLRAADLLTGGAQA